MDADLPRTQATRTRASKFDHANIANEVTVKALPTKEEKEKGRMLAMIRECGDCLHMNR
jgi:hypothetical protein